MSFQIVLKLQQLWVFFQNLCDVTANACRQVGAWCMVIEP
jgi:hypothetical protein